MSSFFFAVIEDVELTRTTDDLPKLSLHDSTNTYGRFSINVGKSSPSILAQNCFKYSSKQISNIPCSTSNTDENLPFAFAFTYSQSTPSEPILTNPFSPSGYAQPTTIFTPKRGTNPFDDDLFFNGI